ncbi:MAG: NAD(P)-binding domain-containing protein [Actinomycetota bacterium]
MAQLSDRPHPPGDYQVVVIGSGPGGIQASYDLRRLGVRTATLSADEKPAGMFQRFPFFQRLITWSKPYAPFERSSREYQWYDWNSLIAEEKEARGLVPQFMDGVSMFPAREEVERATDAFVERTGLPIRFGCRWESTRRDDGDRGFVVTTSDGEYRCEALVLAVGMSDPWVPDTPGIDKVPHYVETEDPKSYADQRVVLIGKRNSGFELADGLEPWARELVLISPRPARISVIVKSTAAARARYLQPYEEFVLGGGTYVIDAAIQNIERNSDGWQIRAHGTTRPGELTIEADRVIAATGFQSPLGDLRELGVATFYQDRLPAQTPFWESTSVPGIYFAGTISQGAVGLKKYGIPSNSAAVHGLRYNARVLAEHIAHVRFGADIERRVLPPGDVAGYLLGEVTRAPELWNQQSYLTRVLTRDELTGGLIDQGISPLAHFVDEDGPDAIAAAVETNESGDIHPCMYLRRGGKVEEHVFEGHHMHDFTGAEQQAQLEGLLKKVLDK